MEDIVSRHLQYVLGVYDSTLTIPKDLSHRVQRSGSQYFAIRTYADVWRGELTMNAGKKSKVRPQV